MCKKSKDVCPKCLKDHVFGYDNGERFIYKCSDCFYGWVVAKPVFDIEPKSKDYIINQIV